MLDSYIILNRKHTYIIKIYYYILIIFTLILTYFIFTTIHITYFKNTSIITLNNNKYYLKLIIPLKKINLITENNFLIIKDKKYNYQIKKIKPHKKNKLLIYLEIKNLDNSYKINNYRIDVKIKEENKLLNYLKSKGGKYDNNN